MRSRLVGAASALLLAAAGASAAPPAGCTFDPAGASPFAWRGKDVLWLGTSIPHQGAGRDSYPEIFCHDAGCRVRNNAFSGSHMRWDAHREDTSCRTGRNAPKGLSATTRELQAMIDAAGTDDGSSSYHASCSRATRPQAMGYEARINAPWAKSPFDAVVIDHGHNDRSPDARRRAAVLGELYPPELALVGLERGLQTRLVLQSGHGLQVGDDISLRSPGMPRMDHWTGEVSGVAGDTITIAFDSRGMAGAYAGGGRVVRHDKSTLYGAYDIVISDILHMNAYYGGPPVLVLLVTPPTEWTGGRNDGSIRAVNEALFRVAGKWGLPVYDMTRDLDMGLEQTREILSDGVHPTTPAARAYIAQHIVRWSHEHRLVFDPCRERWVEAAAARQR